MKLRIALLILLAIVTGAAVWFGVRSAGQMQTIARLENELRAARSLPAQPSSSLEEVQPSHAEPRVPSQPHPSTRKLQLPEKDTSAPLRAQIEQLTNELTAAHAHSAELQMRIDSLTADNQRLAAAQADAKEQIAELRKILDNANYERAAVDQKLQALDTEVQTLRQQNRTAGDRTQELAKSAAELQDVLRRQQTYVNNVVSRYREITDILRTPAAPAGSRDLGPDLVRAGSLISMTDEDLRAVRELNSRLALIQKRLLAAASRK